VRSSRRSPHALRALRPRKRFGQHFLEPAWVEKLIRAIDAKPDQTFLEIGPGRGALTLPLAARALAVTAYEIDRDLAAALEAARPANVTVVTGDFLAARAPMGGTSSAPTDRLRIVGNLPYNVASPILFKLVEWYRAGVPFADATLMLQREVADRLSAKPGTHDYGVLTILIGRHAQVERLLTLPPGALRPAPKVHSAVVRLRFHAPEPPTDDDDLFAALVKSAFTRRRKTMANALAGFAGGRLRPADALGRAGLDGGRRPETLTPAEWGRLADVYVSSGAVL
jgi:16S rRNA (adenine1518-N6/adenine1519-N6)-dimethyltransferase